MLINLPPNFGAALLRKRAARGAPRRRGISTGDPVIPAHLRFDLHDPGV
jgi:hypothetical protein